MVDTNETSEDDECEMNTISPSTGRYYCIDIYFLFITICFISLTIFSGLLFIKAAKKHVVLTHPISTVPCTTPSITGQSCITKNTSSNLLTQVYLNKAPFRQNKYEYYSSSYVSKSNGSIITFVFPFNSKGYLDNISFYDIRNEIELMNNGGFEDGNLNSYCLCDPWNNSIKATGTSAYKSRFGCVIDVGSSTMKFSQLVNTSVGRVYTIGFWYNVRDASKNEMRVYITPVYNPLTYETTFL